MGGENLNNANDPKISPIYKTNRKTIYISYLYIIAYISNDLYIRLIHKDMALDI